MDIIKLLSICSPLIPLIAGIRHRFTLLWMYALTGLAFDLLIPLLKRVLHINYNWAANLFVLLEFLLVSFYYKDKIFRNKALFYIVATLMSAFFIITCVHKGVWAFNAFAASTFFFAFIVYGIAGLYNILQRQDILFLERSSFFWANVAFIMYASGNFLLFLFMDYLSEYNDSMLRMLWGASFLILNILKNLFLGVALSKKVQY